MPSVRAYKIYEDSWRRSEANVTEAFTLRKGGRRMHRKWYFTISQSAPSFLKMMEQPISDKKQCCSTPPAIAMWPSSPWYAHLRYMRWGSPCTPLVSADFPRPKGTPFPPPVGICTIFGMTCHLCSSPLLLPGLAVTLPALLRVKLEVCWRVTAKMFIVPRAK